MKKPFIFAASLLCAGLVGGMAAFGVMKAAKDDLKQVEVMERIVEVEQGVPVHFTAFKQEAYPDLTYAAENAIQAVVNIEVTQEVRNRTSLDPFLELFGVPQGYSLRDNQPRERKVGGSGVIISPDGYVVTNHHVIDNATKMKVKLYDGRLFDAELVGTDPATEVALIKVDARALPYLVFGSSNDLRLGEWVLAIGSPFDLQSTITAGIVSAKARHLGAIANQYSVESFIQTDAAVNPGNSGGALVNTKGELVGINTLIKSHTGSYAGYSFAVPSSIVRKVVSDLKEYGVVQRAVLGVSYRIVDADFLEEFGERYKIKEIGGVYVATVDPAGAAAAAGIKEGDVIVKVDGVAVDASVNFAEVISRYRPNDKVKISVKRDGKVKQIDVVLRNKAGKAELLSKDSVDIVQVLGGRFAEITDKTKKELRINNGVRVVDVAEGGILARARINKGFIITHINDIAIRSVGDLDKIEAPVALIEGISPNGRIASYSIIQ